MRIKNTKNDIKSIIIKEGYTMKTLSETLSKKTNEEISQQNLNNKVNREQLRYIDILNIADILGYDIEWIKKEEDK